MSSTLFEPASPSGARDGLSAADRVRMQVLGLLAAIHPRFGRLERRGDLRHPYPYLVQITPVGADGRTPAGESVVVVGKHLSERGLSFYHPKMLPFRRVLVVLETALGHHASFLMDLRWCRFTPQGWYESGGRFLDALPSVG